MTLVTAGGMLSLVLFAVHVSSSAGAGQYDVNDLFQQVMARMEMDTGMPPQLASQPKSQMLRDQEYLQHSASLWGNQHVTGGAGEGLQFLKPEGSVPNVHEVKTDPHLPAYCNPPNPCPVGFSADKDHCMEGMPNQADYVRQYQEKQDCMCDKEHMIECPETMGNPPPAPGNSPPITGNEVDMLDSAIGNMLEDTDAHKDFMADNHISLVAKKGEGWKQDHNPYLVGDKLPTVAKKSPPVF